MNILKDTTPKEGTSGIFLTGTEEEILEYITEKYDLVKREVKEVAAILEAFEKKEEVPVPDPHSGGAFPNKPAPCGGSTSTGFRDMFKGTSWGK